VNYDILRAEYISAFIIRLYFRDGRQGDMDFCGELDGEIFEPLKDVNYFKSFKLSGNTIYWENGADFAPEYLYDKVNAFVLK
jgi:hypothetical protein